MKIRKVISRLGLAGLVVLGSISVGTNAPVSAIADGANPSSCGSPVTAYAKSISNTMGITVAFLELRYSSSCPGSPNRATWARIANSFGNTCVPADSWCSYARVVRNGVNRPNCFTPAGGSSCFTGAAADIGSTSAYAFGYGENNVTGGTGVTASLAY